MSEFKSGPESEQRDLRLSGVESTVADLPDMQLAAIYQTLVNLRQHWDGVLDPETLHSVHQQLLDQTERELIEIISPQLAQLSDDERRQRGEAFRQFLDATIEVAAHELEARDFSLEGDDRFDPVMKRLNRESRESKPFNADEFAEKIRADYRSMEDLELEQVRRVQANILKDLAGTLDKNSLQPLEHLMYKFAMFALEIKLEDIEKKLSGASEEDKAAVQEEFRQRALISYKVAIEECKRRGFVVPDEEF